jgi:hypothetical protein
VAGCPQLCSTRAHPLTASCTVRRGGGRARFRVFTRTYTRPALFSALGYTQPAAACTGKQPTVFAYPSTDAYAIHSRAIPIRRGRRSHPHPLSPRTPSGASCAAREPVSRSHVQDQAHLQCGRRQQSREHPVVLRVRHAELAVVWVGVRPRSPPPPSPSHQRARFARGYRLRPQRVMSSASSRPSALSHDTINCRRTHNGVSPSMPPAPAAHRSYRTRRFTARAHPKGPP